MDTALASGAHAAAFPPYPLDRSAPEVLAGYEANGIENLPPSKFLWYTDGGTIDNEPLGRALGLTQEIDASAEDPLGSACRLHMMITPDPARPVSGDDAWSTRDPGPTWTRTGFRTLKLLRVQRLYDDLRELEKTNSRIEWVRLLEHELASIIERGGADAVAGLEKATATINEQRAALTSPEDLRSAADDDTDTPLRLALRSALDAATGLSKKRDVAVAVVSPLLLPEVAAGAAPKELLAGDFLAHFGGFLDQRLRECDFGLGYRSMLCWLEGGGLATHGLDAELSEVAVAATRAARDRWSDRAGRRWADGLGDTNLKSLPWSARWRLYRVALRSARIAFSRCAAAWRSGCLCRATRTAKPARNRDLAPGARSRPPHPLTTMSVPHPTHLTAAFRCRAVAQRRPRVTGAELRRADCTVDLIVIFSVASKAVSGQAVSTRCGGPA